MEAFQVLRNQWTKKESKNKLELNKVMEELKILGVRKRLFDMEAEALLQFMQCTVRKARLWRLYIGAIASAKG